MHYRYDGSYSGLLTVLQRCFAWDEVPEVIDGGGAAQAGLFAEVVEVATDPVTARQLLQRIRRDLDRESERNLRHAWCAEVPGKELALYRYLASGWRLGRRLDELIARPEVAAVHARALKVRREAHRLLGLVRFGRTAEGLYYAPLEPDHFVLPLLGAHFAARLGNERWLIHDRRRGCGLLGDGRHWTLATLEQHAEPQHTADEEYWQGLWKTFFRHIAVAERSNPQQQRQCMPMKYWKYLVEMEEQEGGVRGSAGNGSRGPVR